MWIRGRLNEIERLHREGVGRRTNLYECPLRTRKRKSLGLTLRSAFSHTTGLRHAFLWLGRNTLLALRFRLTLLKRLIATTKWSKFIWSKFSSKY